MSRNSRDDGPWAKINRNYKVNFVLRIYMYTDVP